MIFFIFDFRPFDFVKRRRTGVSRDRTKNGQKMSGEQRTAEWDSVHKTKVSYSLCIIFQVNSFVFQIASAKRHGKKTTKEKKNMSQFEHVPRLTDFYSNIHIQSFLLHFMCDFRYFIPHFDYTLAYTRTRLHSDGNNVWL